MNFWSRSLLAGFALMAAGVTRAQQQPVIAVDITDVTVYSGGELGIELAAGGSGYTSVPTVDIIGGGGVGARAVATISGAVQSITITNSGTGYTTAPQVSIAGGGGQNASAFATIADGSIASVTITNPGVGFTGTPTVTFSGGGGSGATAEAVISGTVTGIRMIDPGVGYSSLPVITLSGGNGSGASAFATLSGTVFDPPNEAFGPAGVTIGITALARGTHMRDSFRYSFFVNGISIGRTQDPVPPPQSVTVPWTPPQPGFYFLTVVADDGANEATSLPIRFFAEGSVVNSPVTNTIVPNGSSVVLKADSTVGGGFIRSIQFYDNGVPIGEPDATIPYSLIYTPPGGPGTAHDITAVATDNNFALLPASEPVRLNVVNSITPLPRSVITSPGHNSSLPIPTGEGGAITVNVDAVSTSGLVSKVELYVDGVLHGTSTNYPYTFSWQPKVVGVYRLVALTYDDKNNVVASTTSTTGTNTPRPTMVTIEPQSSTTPTATTRVYRGTYVDMSTPGSSANTVAVHRGTGGTGVLIAHAGGTSPQVHYFENFEVEGDGRFSLYDGPTTLVDGQLSATGAFGTFADGQATFSAPLSSGASSFQGSGLLTGTVGGRSDSTFAAIIAPDGRMTVYVRDGANEDAGTGPIRASGAFEFPTVRGAVISGQMAAGGTSLTATFSGGPVSGTVTATPPAGIAAASDGSLVNLSTRGSVGTGDRQLIAGFVVAPDATDRPKQVLIRAVGPSLSAFGVSSAVAEPSLTLRDGQGNVLAYNKRWSGTSRLKAASAYAGAFAVQDSSQDSSLLEELAPGNYTVQMSAEGSGGLGLIEIYDVDPLDPYSQRRVLNLSTRGHVGSGQETIIAGVTISGTKPKRVLVRGVGPALGTLPGWPGGELANPVLTLRRENTVIRTNDDWDQGDDRVAVREAAAAVGAFPLPSGGKDAALLITLPPGAYTAELAGVGGSTGIALIEVYDVD